MTYYRNVFQVEGPCSGQLTTVVANEEVSAERMAQLLIAQGSSPEFLLGEEGV